MTHLYIIPIIRELERLRQEEQEEEQRAFLEISLPEQETEEHGTEIDLVIP